MPEVGMREWLAVGRVIARRDLLRYGPNGRETERFEKNFATFMGSAHALTLTSGTAALTTALASAGIGPGDEVLVPAYTWMASASAVVTCGAVPVLVDIDETLTMDPADIERRLSPYTRAIIPVHMVNAPADMDAIMQIAAQHKLLVIEDACQAVGVMYKGRRVGSIGHAGALSFNRYKNMNIGEGGALVTNDATLFARALNYHDLGSWIRGYQTDVDVEPFVGVNLRVTEIYGAMLNVQLARLPAYLERLRVRRAAIASVLTGPDYPRLSPHHDASAAIGATVIFDTEAEAVDFAARTGAVRLYDSSKHVYTSWEPILARRAVHPKLNPWTMAPRDIQYTDETCARSLEILKRSCKLWINDQRPAAWVRHKAVRQYRNVALPASRQTLAVAATAHAPAAGLAS